MSGWYAGREWAEAWADVEKCRAIGFEPDPRFIDLLRKASGRTGTKLP